MARILRWSFALAAVLLLLEVVSLSMTMRDLQDASDRVVRAGDSLGTSPSGWTAARIAKASSDAGDAQVRLTRDHERLSGDPLLAALQDIPLLGDQVRATVDLGAAADHAARAFQDYLVVARQLDSERASSGPPGPRFVRLLKAGRAPLGDASSHLAAASTLLAADRDLALVVPIYDRVHAASDRLGPALGRARALAEVARLAPSALGDKSARSYLLLFSNPAEIRPAGGFVGAAGSLTVRDGSIEGLDIRAEQAFTPNFKKTFTAPEPLPRFFDFKKAPFEIGDAGWDPNFAGSARTSEEMFTSATGKTVDGTVSLDPYAISAILGVTGPVEVPGIGSFDRQNFFADVDYIVNAKPGPGSGKDTLPVIAQAIIHRVLDLPTDRWLNLVSALQDQAAGRHILLYMHDHDLAAAAAGAHYDGAILPATDDYLMVVDANVGATKGDYYVRKSASFKAELSPGGISRHELVLRYEMPQPVDDVDRALNRENAGAYSDYLRVYLPETATGVTVSYSRTGGTGLGGLERLEVIDHKTVLSSFVQVDRGYIGTLRILYQVAIGGTQSYRLLVQKEAGIPGRQLDMLFSYPGGTARRQDAGARDNEVNLNW